MKNIVIIGAGGFGREVKWFIDEINGVNKQWNFIGFVDDNLPKGTVINDSNVIGDVAWLHEQNLNVVCAIADPIIKKRVLERLTDSKNSYPVLIHPDVRVSKFVNIGEGTIICPGCIITVNIKIGKHVILDYDSTVGHDAIIGDFSTILPGVSISGHVNIEELVSVGTGAKIIQGLRIGKNTIIGAGAIVTKDIPQNVVAVGVPAKPIKIRE
ncbi:MAG: putative acetyltransferase EpsM [Tenericutes bacterium ADurb.BinA124]|nr:MAG: putative acetyltransferase EpsM [Tenericutes bacterium ADurb.BinA124]